MQRNKKIYIMLGILLVISIVTFGVSKYESHKENIKNSEKIILEIDSNDVTSLSWEKGSKSFSFQIVNALFRLSIIQLSSIQFTSQKKKRPIQIDLFSYSYMLLFNYKFLFSATWFIRNRHFKLSFCQQWFYIFLHYIKYRVKT